MPYCQSCGGEFVEGVSVCPVCERPLTAEPAEQPWDDPSRPTAQWETVLETGDPALLAAARSVLQGAGVPFVVIGEGLQSLAGMGVIGRGYNPIFGPARVRVPADRVEEASALLSEEAEPAADPEALTPEAAAAVGSSGRSGGGSRGWASGVGPGAALGLLVGILAGVAITVSGKLDRGGERPSWPVGGVSPMDGDGDGRPDAWSHYEDGVLRSMSQDGNYDGEPDSWTEFDRRSLRTSWRTDQNYDGEPDSFTRYEQGRAVAIEQDADFDGDIDLWTDLGEDELPNEQREDTDGDDAPDVWYEFDDAGALVAGRFDTNFDGTPDDLDQYEAGDLVTSRRDTDFDGTYDVTISYRNQSRETVTWDARPGAPARKLTYRHGLVAEELRDRDGDGAWDLRIVYDPFEYPVEEVELP